MEDTLGKDGGEDWAHTPRAKVWEVKDRSSGSPESSDTKSPDIVGRGEGLVGDRPGGLRAN